MKPDKDLAGFPIPGNNVVSRRIIQNDWDYNYNGSNLGRIWINDKQYFDKIPVKVWELYLGGYQPAQKWLKEQVGSNLTFDEIKHYQKIISALAATIVELEDSTILSLE